MAPKKAPPDPEADLIVAAPGRINLIGEHTDYNLGYVLPAAIDKTITFAFRKKPGSRLATIYSRTNGQSFEVSLDAIARSAVSWENYLLGVLYEITKRTDKLEGFDCHLESGLPIGSGLSSSAALECGLAFGLNTLFDLGLQNHELIALSQMAEHTFVGTQCGIMDQFASVMGREGHFILLDCKTLQHSYVPCTLDPYKILLLNSNVSHTLATSEYNLRKKECEAGVAILKQAYPRLDSLRDATHEMLEACKDVMGETVFNRCSYIVQENHRVLEIASLLPQNNLAAIGTLLYEAHDGLSNLYEISCAESDFLVEFSKGFDAVLGARQMGGGFGGCTLNLIHKDAIELYTNRVSRAYHKAFKRQLTAFEGVPSRGVHVV